MSNLVTAMINSNEKLNNQIDFRIYKEFTDFLIARSGTYSVFAKYKDERPDEGDVNVEDWLKYFVNIYKGVDHITFTNHYNESYIVDGPGENVSPWYWIVHVIAKMRHDKSTINTNNNIKWKCELHFKSGDVLISLYHGWVINSISDEIIRILKDSIFNRFYTNLYLKKLQRTMNSDNFRNILPDVYHQGLIEFSERLSDVISVGSSYYLDVFKQVFNLLTNISSEITVTISDMSGFEAIGNIVDDKTMVISILDLYHEPELKGIYFKDGIFDPISIIKNTKRIIDENLNKIDISDFKY